MRFCPPFLPCLGSALGFLPSVTEATQKYCRPLSGCSLVVVLPQLLPKATGQQLLYEGMLFTRSWCAVKRDTWQPHTFSLDAGQHHPTPCPAALLSRHKWKNKNLLLLSLSSKVIQTHLSRGIFLLLHFKRSWAKSKYKQNKTKS